MFNIKLTSFNAKKAIHSTEASAAPSMRAFAAQNASSMKAEADIRGAVYAFVASSGHQSDYDSIKGIYLQASSPLFSHHQKM